MARAIVHNVCGGLAIESGVVEVTSTVLQKKGGGISRLGQKFSKKKEAKKKKKKTCYNQAKGKKA